MRQKITVYGLRFSKTTFWNCLNTGFLEPAVATALTARGIETITNTTQHIDNAVVATALTARGIETVVEALFVQAFDQLQQRLPLAVLKLSNSFSNLFVNSLSCNSAYRSRY